MSDSPTIQELFDLTGRTALITGATGLLGNEMARAVAEAGGNVVVSSVDQVRAQQAAEQLPAVATGQRHFGVALDLHDEDSLHAGFAAAVAKTGAIDILINNAHRRNLDQIDEMTAAAFDECLRHATSYFLLSRDFRDHVVSRQATGSIVMIGSMYGVVGSYPECYEGVAPSSPVHYHTLKGGLIQMTRHLAVYWAADGLRVNCLSPGPFPKDNSPGKMVDRLVPKSPLKRMGQAHEVKGALLLLASDAGSYITGQNLLVDGGWTAW